MNSALKVIDSRFLTSTTLRVWILLIAGVAVAFPSCADELYREWVRTYRLDASRTNAASKMALTSDGIIVAGTSANTNGDSDYFLIKYRSNGEEAWKQRYGHAAGSEDGLRDLAIDPNGNVFVTGTSDTVKFDSTGVFKWAASFSGRALAVTTNFVYVTGFSETDFATAQLTNNSSDGGLAWMRMYRSSGYVDVSQSIAIDSTGEIVIGGGESLSFGGRRYSFLGLVKYSPSGVQRWHARMDQFTIGTMALKSLRVDQGGAVFVFVDTGGGGQLTHFAPDGSIFGSSGILTSPGEMKLTSDGAALCLGGGDAAFVDKMGGDQTLQWKQFLTPAGVVAYARNLDIAAAGEIYTGGIFLNDSQDYHIFVSKLASDGSKRFYATYDSLQHGSDFANAIVVDKNCNVYVTGYSTTAEGGSEFVTIKYSSGGKAQRNIDGGIHVQFPAPPGLPYAIEASTNFVAWRGLVTNTVDFTGFIQFDDTNSSATPFRFYRGKTSP